jgi:16S rRNA (cytosine1402-N4)-methyltransferase
MLDSNSKKNYIPHVSVLKDKVIEYLITNKSGIYIDGTLGSGGHARSILNELNPDGKLIGIDRDLEAIDYCRKQFSDCLNQVELIHGEFGQIDEILDTLHVTAVDGFLLDLGISNHQLECGSRGFSYQKTGPMDMRMDTSGQMTAGEIVNRYSEKALADMIYRYGEERHSRRIAREIVNCREKAPIEATDRLADIIRRITPPKWQVKTLSRIFQSIRVELNQELNQLVNGLVKIVPYLKLFGRIVCISYHSLEDRIVKNFFRGTCQENAIAFQAVEIPDVSFRILTKKVVRPDQNEIDQNSKSRAALLRAAEITGK